jgi:hypothetical protein
VLVVGQDVAQVGAVRTERCGPVADAVEFQLAHDGRQAVLDGDRQPDEELTVGLAGDAGQPAEGPLAVVLELDPLPAQAVRPDRPQEAPVPGQALDVRLFLVGAIRGQLHEVGQTEAGLPPVPARLLVVVGDQPLHRRGLVAGDPQDGAVAPDGREVGVGTGRPRRLLELQAHRSFHGHAIQPDSLRRDRASLPPTRLDGPHEVATAAL